MTYIPSGKEEEQFLQSYDPSKYQNPAVAADTALFAVDRDSIKLLLIKRGNYPYKGCWALPGGFVDINEDIKNSAKRELLEETGLTDVYCEQAFVWGRPDRDPRARIITVSYIALADFNQLHAKAGDDAAEAEWFTLCNYNKNDVGGIINISYTLNGIETLTPTVTYPAGRIQEITPIESSGLAFDHAESIAYSFECLKHRIMHSDFLNFALKDTQHRMHAQKLILGV